MKVSTLLLLLTYSSSNVNAFTASFGKVSSFSSKTSSSYLQATAADAIASLDASQAATVNKIASSIPDLAPKPELSWTDEPIAGIPTKIDARDAPGSANIAWLASVCVPSKMSSLTIFNGPLTDVPHLLSRCIINENTNSITFALDFRPRAYGAYELADSERGPDKLGRDSFTFSGNRKDYETKFATEEVVAFMQSAAQSFEGATVLSVDENEYETATRGPHFMKFEMPLTDGNIAAVVTAREKAADYWLSWALEDTHAHRPGAPINSQYVYDSKYRQNAYLALLPVYNAVFGADGPSIAAAESGPLDEGYVGGGS